MFELLGMIVDFLLKTFEIKFELLSAIPLQDIVYPQADHRINGARVVFIRFFESPDSVLHGAPDYGLHIHVPRGRPVLVLPEVDQRGGGKEDVPPDGHVRVVAGFADPAVVEGPTLHHGLFPPVLGAHVIVGDDLSC